MTPEVRAAAKNLLLWTGGHVDYPGVFDRDVDIELVARAVLASVPEDGWTDTPPTVHGWYWWEPEDCMPEIREVFDEEDDDGNWYLCVETHHDEFKNVAKVKGRWSGPLVPPPVPAAKE